MNSPKVRPKVLLYTLLACHVATAIFFAIMAHKIAQIAKPSFSESEIREGHDAFKKTINAETNIEKLRSWALEYSDETHMNARTNRETVKKWSRIFYDVSILAGVTALGLGGALNGLQRKRTTTKQEQPDPQTQ